MDCKSTEHDILACESRLYSPISRHAIGTMIEFLDFRCYLFSFFDPGVLSISLVVVVSVRIDIQAL